MKWKNLSINKKLIMLIFISEIIILSFSSTIIISFVANQQEEQIYSNAIEICKNYSNKLNGDFRECLAISETIAKFLEIHSINSKKEIVLLLKKIINYNEKIIGSYVCYDSNYLDNKDSSLFNIDYFNKDKFCPYCFKDFNGILVKPLNNHDLINLYFETKNTTSIITTPFYFENVFILSIFSPIFKDNNLIGVIGLDISLNYIDTIVNKVRLFDSGYAFFVSNNGIFLSHPLDKNFIGLKTLYDLGDPLFVEAANDIKNEKSGIFKTKDPFSEKEVIVFYEPIHIDGSSFLLVIPENEIIDSIHQLMKKLITISIFSLIFILIISCIISSWILNSIKKITFNFIYIANKIANGELNIRTNVDVDMDFKPILLSLNEVLKSITSHVNETKNIIHNLEKGNFKSKIKTNLKGDFFEIGYILSKYSNNLNNIITDSIDVLSSFQKNEFSRAVKYYGNGDFKKLTNMIEKTRLAMIKITQNYIRSETNLKIYASNLKKSNDIKKELEMIVDRSPIFIFKIKMDNKYTMLFMSNNINQLGYKIEDFKSGKKTYFDLIYFEDLQKIKEKILFHFNSNDLYFSEEYRILTGSKEIKWIESRMYFNKISDEYTELQGINFDITERKIAEEKLKMSEQLQKKEIHHRIKNNLQVISTLLYLESSKFEDINVKSAFENSQNRIKSMALIHEELYRSNKVDTQKINFKSYILKLTEYLFQSYKTTTKKIILKLEIEELYLSMDIAIPLGTIINELITNSLKYAFIKKNNGLIWIKLENAKENKKILYIGDNGISIKKVPDLDNISSLGLQLVHALVTQIDGSIQINIENGLEYKIEFETK